MPGCRSMIRYCPDPSVVADRVFSISAGLAASTTTPGSTAPEGSWTVPVRMACAKTVPGRSRTARNARHFADLHIADASFEHRLRRLGRLERVDGARTPRSAHAERGKNKHRITECQ